MKQISFIFTPSASRCAGDELKIVEQRFDSEPNTKPNDYQSESNQLGESHVE